MRSFDEVSWKIMAIIMSPEQVWHVWQDVENWNSWDHDLESSGIDGVFQTGVTGYLKSKDGPILKIPY